VQGEDLSEFFLDTDECCRSLLPPEDQEELPDIKQHTLSENPSPPIFKGRTFYRHSTFPMPHDELKGLIECAGGTLLAPGKPHKTGGNVEVKVL